jgi:hypothetical protein
MDHEIWATLPEGQVVAKRTVRTNGGRCADNDSYEEPCDFLSFDVDRAHCGLFLRWLGETSYEIDEEMLEEVDRCAECLEAFPVTKEKGT